MDEESDSEEIDGNVVAITGIGWEIGSRPIRILLAFSDSFSHALANSCSA